MAIKIKSYLTLRQAMENKPCIEINCGPIKIIDLLELLASRFGQDFESLVFEADNRKVSAHIRILLNGRHYRTLPEKIETVVNSGDEICLFPPMAGG